MKPLKPNRRTAAAILGGSLAAAAALFPGCNRMAAVYGPPPVMPGDTAGFERSTEYAPNENPEKPVRDLTEKEAPGSTEFDPYENIPAEVYGPPPEMDMDEESEEAAEDAFEPEAEPSEAAE